jgi:hypothetical protein
LLSYLLGLIQQFERAHGRVPILLSLNARHLQLLLNECPELGCNDGPFPFGFRISVLPEEELAHPVVSLIPVMHSIGERSRIVTNDRHAQEQYQIKARCSEHAGNNDLPIYS